MRTAIRAALCVVLTFFAGCQEFGPASLEHGRVNYNSAIQDTQMKEVFANIIRVRNTEPTLFVNISEIDASITLQAAESTQVAAAKGITSTFTGPSFTYTDQPIIKYVPLNGPELVAQIASPIEPSSIANLLDSNWHLVPVLQLTVSRLTPQYDDIGAALNAIGQLDEYGALVLTEKDAQTAPGDSGNGAAKAISGLVLYLQPNNPSIAPVIDERIANGQTAMPNDNTPAALLEARKNILHLWIRLLRIYYDAAKTPQACNDSCLADFDARGSKATGETDLDAIFNAGKFPGRIELHSDPAVSGAHVAAPVFLTRSALGVLKYTSFQGGGITVLDVDKSENVDLLKAALARAAAARKTCVIWPDYYLLPLSPPKPLENTDYSEDTKAVDDTIDAQKCPQETLYPTGQFDTSDFRTIRREFMYMTARQFILIEKSAQEPADAYVSEHFGDSWYYIDVNDGISQLNFLLLSQLLTMQAISPSAKETTPVTLPLH